MMEKKNHVDKVLGRNDSDKQQTTVFAAKITESEIRWLMGEKKKKRLQESVFSNSSASLDVFSFLEDVFAKMLKC